MKKQATGKYICLVVVLIAVTCFSWLFIDSYLVWRKTEINALYANARALASIAGVGVLFGSAFWALKVKERQSSECGSTQDAKTEPDSSQRSE